MTILERTSTNSSNAGSKDRDRDPPSQSAPSLAYSGNENQHPMTSATSTAPTVSTEGTNGTMGEGARSDEVHSKSGTLTTAGGAISTGGGGEGSTFSSPAPSVRSMATTLTTVQSAATSAQVQGPQNQQPGLTHVTSIQSNQQGQLSHQFPTTPISAVPQHLAPHGHSSSHASANNALTDNASTLTLASSSKRRRRNSVDTNASIRALPPSSLFGGSRDSLPLSLLSANATEPSSASAFNVGGIPNRPSLVGHASTERASIYSVPGSVAAAHGERASLHANKQQGHDGASIKSGYQSTHARNDSAAASISQAPHNDHVSRRSSIRGEMAEGESDDEKLENESKSEERSECRVQSAIDSEKPSESTIPEKCTTP